MDHFLTAGLILLQSNLLGWINVYFHNSNSLSLFVKLPPTYFTKLPSLCTPACITWICNPRSPNTSLDQVPATASYMVSLLPVPPFQWSLSNAVSDTFQRKLLSVSHLNLFQCSIAVRIKTKNFNKVCRALHNIASTYPSSFILCPHPQPLYFIFWSYWISAFHFL